MAATCEDEKHATNSLIQGYENEYILYKNGSVFGIKKGAFLKQCLAKNGYLVVNLWKNNKGKLHCIHRLLALHFLQNPENKKNVDHINGIRTDNRLENLRWATDLENSRNRKTRSNNTSGAKNVYWSKREKKWIVKIIIEGRYKQLGTFSDFDDAVKFAKMKRDELFGEFANHN